MKLQAEKGKECGPEVLLILMCKVEQGFESSLFIGEFKTKVQEFKDWEEKDKHPKWLVT